MPSASSTMTIASVPLATPIVSATPRYSAASRSNAFTFGPRMNCPDSSTSEKARSSFGISGAYCALTSTSGISGTLGECRGASVTQDQVARENEDSCNHEVLDVAEAVMEALVARAERPPDGGEREAPQRRADQRQHRVPPERDPEDAGRDRHERAHDRRDPAQED